MTRKKSIFESSQQRKAVLKYVGYVLLAAVLSSFGIHITREEVEAIGQGDLPLMLETKGLSQLP